MTGKADMKHTIASPPPPLPLLLLPSSSFLSSFLPFLLFVGSVAGDSLQKDPKIPFRKHRRSRCEWGTKQRQLHDFIIRIIHFFFSFSFPSVHPCIHSQLLLPEGPEAFQSSASRASDSAGPESGTAARGRSVGSCIRSSNVRSADTADRVDFDSPAADDGE